MRTGCIVRDGRPRTCRPLSLARQRLGLLRLAAVLALALITVVLDDADARSFRVELTHGAVEAEFTPASRPCGLPKCPLVVLVPGFAVPMAVWNANISALAAAGFPVLRFDFYGRGRSARPRVDYRPELFAEQVWELVTAPQLPRELRPPNRIHMVASSMGAAIAAVFAARHPDTLDRLVLVGPVGLASDFPLLVTFLRAPGIGRWYFASRFETVMLDHLQDNLNVDVCAFPAVLAEFQRQLQIPGTADAMFSTFRNTLLADVENDYRQLGRLHLPTLAIWGSEDRLVPSEQAARQLGRMVPHLKVEKIHGAGHLPQLERPRQFNALVARFLAQ